MNSNKQELIISTADKLKMGDSIGGKPRNKKKVNTDIRPCGVVEIYEKCDDGNKKLLHKNNLIVYSGREWVASRLFNTENSNIDQSENEYIGWAGVGDGGISIDPLDPDNPTNSDLDLISPVILSTTNTSYCDQQNLNEYYKKPLNDLNAITFETDSANEDRYLIVKVSFGITEDDANGYNLSEAGLYTSESSSDLTPYNLFARVTFPTIVKTVGRDLLFIWYIYC